MKCNNFSWWKIRIRRACDSTSTIREVKEERYIVFLLITSDFEGTLINETHEGKVFWMHIDKIKDYKLSLEFKEMLDIFQGKGAEFFYEDLNLENENQRWLKKYY